MNKSKGTKFVIFQMKFFLIYNIIKRKLLKCSVKYNISDTIFNLIIIMFSKKILKYFFVSVFLNFDIHCKFHLFSPRNSAIVTLIIE